MPAWYSLQMLSYCKVPFVKPKWLLLLGRCLSSLYELAAILLMGWGAGRGFSCLLSSFPAVRTSQKISLYRLFLIRGVTDLNNTWINADSICHTVILNYLLISYNLNVFYAPFALTSHCFVNRLPLFPGTALHCHSFSFIKSWWYCSFLNFQWSRLLQSDVLIKYILSLYY